jgi:hypothetical protein
MVEYIESPNIKVAFSTPVVKNCLAEILSLYGKKQLHIAETEKYAHITYFFNCLQGKPFDGETDTLQPQGDASSATAPASDASGGSVPEAALLGTEPVAGEAPAVSSASSALMVIPRGALSATSTPRSTPTQVITPVSPTPRGVPPPPVFAAPKPLESVVPVPVVESVATAAPQTTSTKNTLLLAVVGIFALALGGFFLRSRSKGNKEKKSNPCGALKQQFEVSKTAYDTATGKLTLQELLIAQLEKEIANVKERLDFLDIIV